MALLREIRFVRQVEGERRRRWFTSETMDLIVWIDDTWSPVSFQLCYDKGKNERALTFSADGKVSHERVDDGESERQPLKATPVLVSGGYFDPIRVRRLFEESSQNLPKPILSFVNAALDSLQLPPVK
ncbi:MAG: hypothetical protein U0441_19970 [Polyangiaceae bacterium]